MEVEDAVPKPCPNCTGEDGEKEGAFLLGLPNFLDIGNGRLRCEETGHELLAKDRESYSRGKACRIALIDAALSKKRPPLNTFLSHPLSRSKLVCSLTGDTINKTEEHIWRHINGKRFLTKLGAISGCEEGRIHGHFSGHSEGSTLSVQEILKEDSEGSMGSGGMQPMLIDEDV